MNIILHADDFGYNEDTCQTTIDLFEKGVLKSATIMVNMPASGIAIEYAKKHPEFSFGIHLTYVDGLLPISSPKNITSLINSENRFLPSNEVRKRALTFRLKKQDIINESLEQINVLKEAGVKVSHLDSHGHLHKFPAFLSALNDISRETGITKVRRVQNIFITPHKSGISSVLNLVFGNYISSHFKSTDYFYMPANSMYIHWSESILHKIKLLPENATLEIGVHPGTDEDWRMKEYLDIQEFAKKIISTQHRSINWNGL